MLPLINMLQFTPFIRAGPISIQIQLSLIFQFIPCFNRLVMLIVYTFFTKHLYVLCGNFVVCTKFVHCSIPVLLLLSGD